MKHVASALLLFLAFQSYGQEEISFDEMLLLADMSFTPLGNFEEIPILPNTVMEYEYAAKKIGGDLEVRYAIRPINVPYEFESEEERLDYLHTVEVENTQYRMFTLMAVLNLSGGVEKRVTEFTEQERKGLGADWAASTLTALDSEFAKGYQFCKLVVLFKKDRAICYCYFLSNNIASVILESNKILKNLKFN